MATTSTRPAALLLAVAAALAGGAVAHDAPIYRLPPLPAPFSLEPGPNASAGVSWQLHQSLSYAPAGGNVRFELSPTVTMVLHDPSAEHTARVDHVAHQLETLDASLQADLDAAAVHRNFLLWQHRARLESHYSRWLELHAADPALADPPGSGLIDRVRFRLAETVRELETLSLQLSVSGVGPLDGSGNYGRPMVTFAQEPLAHCLSTGRELNRLLLLAELDEASVLAEEADRRLRVELTAGLDMALDSSSGPVSPSIGWSAGLSIRPNDYSGGNFRLDASPGRIAQSLTFRGPEPAGDPPPADRAGLHRAVELESIRLKSLLTDIELAADWEELLRSELEGMSAGIPAGGRADLERRIDAVTALYQAVLQHDLLIVQAAVDCGASLSYVAP